MNGPLTAARPVDGAGAARKAAHMLKVYLVRHGETEWSLAGRHTGRTDLPLTENGRQQATALRDSLHGEDFLRVLSSPRLRARETCELAGLGDAQQTDPDLAEWDYGDYEGRTTAEITTERPGWNIFRDGCPNGETPTEISLRADRVIRSVLALDGSVIVFSHGHFGCVLGARWIGLAVESGPSFALSPASLSILGQSPHQPEKRVISQWNAQPGAPRA
jgi:probable phosphoglycerate mutase